MIQLSQLSELAKLSPHKSRNLLSDVNYYRNKIYTVFYIHTVFISNSVFFGHTFVYLGRTISGLNLHSKPIDWFLYDNGLRHERVKRLLKSSEEKSYVFVNRTKLFYIHYINEDVR